MKKILVLQFRTDKSLAHEREVLMRITGLKSTSFKFINLLDKKASLPGSLNNFRAMILGGSGEFNISNWPADVENSVMRIKPLVEEAIKKDFPTLGICFGHQLIAEATGGKVIADPAQAESGTIEIIQNKAGPSSEIFKNMPSKFYVVAGHKDSVIKKPKNAKTLAYSTKGKYQAFQYKNNIFTVQFHPELNKAGLLWRLSFYPSYTKVRSLEDIKREYHETPHAKKLIQNFMGLVDAHWL
jgi:GMP synthase (glutamine-hydrolysing)